MTTMLPVDPLEHWRRDALWAVTKSDVKALTEDLDLTDDELSRIYHRVEGMDASYMMECVLEIIHDEVVGEDDEKRSS